MIVIDRVSYCSKIMGIISVMLLMAMFSNCFSVFITEPQRFDTPRCSYWRTEKCRLVFPRYITYHYCKCSKYIHRAPVNWVVKGANFQIEKHLISFWRFEHVILFNFFVIYSKNINGLFFNLKGTFTQKL